MAIGRAGYRRRSWLTGTQECAARASRLQEADEPPDGGVFTSIGVTPAPSAARESGPMTNATYGGIAPLPGVVRDVERDRAAAQAWARALFESPGWAVLDTETTGLDGSAEVVQLAVLSPRGDVLLNTLLRPTRAIPWAVTAIHGITDDHVAGAPSYREMHDRLCEISATRALVSYNASFDSRLLRQTAAAHGLRPARATWECAMVAYARYAGQWDPRRDDYRYQKLPPLPGVPAHNALADCFATLALLRRMAGLE